MLAQPAALSTGASDDDVLPCSLLQTTTLHAKQTACQTRTAANAQLVRSIMDEAAAAGLNLVRAWAHASSPEYALQPSPGRFSEPVFRGLDYALDQARRRGLKVSATFTAHSRPAEPVAWKCFGWSSPRQPRSCLA